jgi:hypothetical protein
MSLAKLTSDLKVKHQKLHETINHSDINLINYNEFPQLKKYLTHDVFGLLEVIDTFGRGVWKELGIDITKCFTGASLSKMNFFKNYYQKMCSVWKLSDKNDKFIRDSYFGGRVECHKMGKIDKAYYYDFTSLYPDVGRKKLPYGKPLWLDFTKHESNKTLNIAQKFVCTSEAVLSKAELDEYNNSMCTHRGIKMTRRERDKFMGIEPAEEGRVEIPQLEPPRSLRKLPAGFFGWVECMVKTRDKKAVPKHAMLKDSRLIFPIIENWTKMTIFSEELDYDIYDYQFIKGIYFGSYNFKAKFFNDGFSKKAKAKAEGNPAMAQAYKIIINSGYGFWGLRTKDRDGIVIFEPNSSGYRKYLDTDKLLSVREHKDYMFCRVMKDLDVSDFNVGVAAAISSYARSKLHALITAIRKNGGKIFYMDTDSVICDINLNDHPDIKAKFQWDGDGTELGSLKNECDEVVEKLLKKIYPDQPGLRKQVFKLLVEREGGNLSFDEGVITGCKQYALRKRLTIKGKTHDIEIVKLKGYSQKDKKLTFDDMLRLNGFQDGKASTIHQQQTQFRCPKSNYVSDTRSFSIRSKKIVKSFRRCYTKGQVFANHVIPLRV